MKKILKIFMMIMIGFAWGGNNAYAGNELWAVLLDVSGSMGVQQEKQVDSPLERNIVELRKIINTLPKGAKIIVIGIGKRSDTELLKAVMPERAGGMSANLIKARQAALKKLNENLEKRISSIDRSNTNIIGGLLKVSRIFAEDKELSKKRLYILSDMLDHANLTMSLKSMKKEGSHRLFLEKAKNIRPYPDLSHVDIYTKSMIADKEKKIKESELEMAIREVKLFWSSYLSAVGANVVCYNTVY